MHRYNTPWYLLLMAACAGADHVAMPRTEPEFLTADASESGIRYYGSSLYLLVHSDAKGHVTSKLLRLPDPTKPMAVRPHAFMATLKSVFKFENGVLVSSAAEGDEAVVPKAVVAAAEKVATAAIAASNRMVGVPDSATVPAPYLFKVTADVKGIHFRGGQGDSSVEVTLPNKESK